MAPRDINKKFIEVLEREIPKKNELVNTLGDILMVDKRTLYRRLNNEVPFTLPEVFLISEYFHISIDTIFRENEYSVVSKPSITNNLYNYYSAIDIPGSDPDYYKTIKHIISHPYSEQCRVLNTPSVVQLMQYPYLSAMISMYYAYMNGQDVKFDDFRTKDCNRYLDRIIEINKLTQSCDYTYILMGPHMGQSVEIIIRYFEKLGFLSRPVIEEMKKELHHIIEQDKEITVTGKYPLTGKKCDIFISNGPVESNYGYVWSEKCVVSVFVMYTLELSISNDEHTFTRMKKWIDTQKKNSVLITGTGEYKRVEFFRRQERIIDSL